MKNRDEARTYLEGVEQDIPEDLLTTWKEEEADWMKKVVDIKNHKTMSNPYVASGDDGRLLCSGRPGGTLRQCPSLVGRSDSELVANRA